MDSGGLEGRPARNTTRMGLTGCASPGTLVPEAEAGEGVEAGGPVARAALARVYDCALGATASEVPDWRAPSPTKPGLVSATDGCPFRGHTRRGSLPQKSSAVTRRAPCGTRSRSHFA